MEEDCWCDYEYLETCEFGVSAPNTPEGYINCGEPAIALVWWDDYHKGMFVCEKHFNEIRICERMEQDREAEITRLSDYVEKLEETIERLAKKVEDFEIELMGEDA